MRQSKHNKLTVLRRFYRTSLNFCDAVVLLRRLLGHIWVLCLTKPVTQFVIHVPLIEQTALRPIENAGVGTAQCGELRKDAMGAIS